MDGVVGALVVGLDVLVEDRQDAAIQLGDVRRDQLPRANGRLYAAELAASEFPGPPLAGFLVATGMVIALAAPVALWVVAVMALLLGT